MSDALEMDSELEGFARDVAEGLAQAQKSLPCRYFYDARGSELFEDITALEEYYPTRTEAAILRDHAAEIARRARGTPRIANNLINFCRDFAQQRGDGVITEASAAAALELLEIDQRGKLSLSPVEEGAEDGAAPAGDVEPADVEA